MQGTGVGQIERARTHAGVSRERVGRGEVERAGACVSEPAGARDRAALGGEQVGGHVGKGERAARVESLELPAAGRAAGTSAGSEPRIALVANDYDSRTARAAHDGAEAAVVSGATAAAAGVRLAVGAVGGTGRTAAADARTAAASVCPDVCTATAAGGQRQRRSRDGRRCSAAAGPCHRAARRGSRRAVPAATPGTVAVRAGVYSAPARVARARSRQAATTRPAAVGRAAAATRRARRAVLIQSGVAIDRVVATTTTSSVCSLAENAGRASVLSPTGRIPSSASGTDRDRVGARRLWRGHAAHVREQAARSATAAADDQVFEAEAEVDREAAAGRERRRVVPGSGRVGGVERRLGVRTRGGKKESAQERDTSWESTHDSRSRAHHGEPPTH